MRYVFLAFMCVLVVGCKYGPLNGTAVRGSIGGKAVPVTGYYTAPNIPVRIEVLNAPWNDPANNSNWDVLATTVTDSTPSVSYGGTDFYKFEVNVTPVPSSPNLTEVFRWSNGKLLRLRAIAQDPAGEQVIPFPDNATFTHCLQDNSGLPLPVIVDNCSSPFTPLAVVSTEENPANNFTNYNFLGDKGKGDVVQTDLYYKSINAPKSLPDFITRYGFPTGEVVTTYYNEADLGLAREMHCKWFYDLSALFGRSVACYVKNFGTEEDIAPKFPADFTKSIRLAGRHTGHFATVAMVYTPPSTEKNAIKFMVYGADTLLVPIPGVTTETLQLTAKLDSTGENAAIPHNCLACHGISSKLSFAYQIVPVVSTEARFLPFDIYAFKYSEEPSLTQAAQLAKFEKLNAMVAMTPMAPATEDFLKGLYKGVMPNLVGGTPTTDRYMPAKWAAGSKQDRLLYEGVMKPFCRGCHMTSTKTSLDFDDPAEFNVPDPAYPSVSLVSSVACTSVHRMPHAEQTLRRFWNSGARAYLSQHFGLAGSGDCSPTP